MRSRDHALDVLRAYAIVAVLGYHSLDLGGAPPIVASALAYGWMGVDLFFVLSGFLIARQVFRSSSTSEPWSEIGRFWVRRWLRTLPLYYLVLFAFVVVKPAVLHYPFLGHTWHYVFFLQNFTAMRDFFPSWSLCVEEQFYALFPLVAFLSRRRAWPPAAVWLLPVVLSLGCRAYVFCHAEASSLGWALSWPSWCHLDGICIGVFLAATEARWSAWARRRWLAPAGLGLLVAACAALGPVPSASLASALLTYPAISAAFAMLLVGAYGMTFAPTVRTVVQRVAVLSYGAYLWHALVSRTVSHLGLTSWPSQTGIFVAATFAISAVTYAIVERPALAFRDSLLAARRRSVGPDTP